MEASLLAQQILISENLEDKLFSPAEITDDTPSPPILFDLPARAPHLRFSKRTKKEKLPKTQFHLPEHRAVCLHRFAGHELLAVEMMAQALLLFPEAPKNFRKGLIHTLLEEQEHVRLYRHELKKFGMELGDMPLYKHFWKHIPSMKDIASYVSMMSLTFEMANLDFAPYYGALFQEAGDADSSALMGRIYTDEIRHVAFGYAWLKKVKDPTQPLIEAWLKNLPELIHPRRAKGPIFQEEGRIKAGVEPSYIEFLKGLS